MSYVEPTLVSKARAYLKARVLRHQEHIYSELIDNYRFRLQINALPDHASKNHAYMDRHVDKLEKKLEYGKIVDKEREERNRRYQEDFDAMDARKLLIADEADELLASRDQKVEEYLQERQAFEDPLPVPDREDEKTL